jgi:hypothetical protein
VIGGTLGMVHFASVNPLMVRIRAWEDTLRARSWYFAYVGFERERPSEG